MVFNTLLALIGLSAESLSSRPLRMKGCDLSCVNLLFAGVATLLILGADQAHAWTPSINPPDQTQAETICPSENLDPWVSGSTAINPGAWANLNRGGTGWQFIYNDSRTQMKAVFFTYSAQGKPTWIATNMVAFQPDGTWKAPFYKYSPTASSVITGSVGIYFFPNDPTRLALRWSWDQLNVHSDPDQLECLSDFNRGGPDYFGGSTDSNGTPETPNEPSLPVKGPNTIFSGFWNATGATNGAPGTMVAIHQNWGGRSLLALPRFIPWRPLMPWVNRYG